MLKLLHLLFFSRTQHINVLDSYLSLRKEIIEFEILISSINVFLQISMVRTTNR